MKEIVLFIMISMNKLFSLTHNSDDSREYDTNDGLCTDNSSVEGSLDGVI